jgi:nitroreductase
MELFTAIKERYSYRGAFLQQPVPGEILRKIVQAGLDAPSGKNLQTTKFVIITDPDKLAQLKALLPERPFVVTAPAFIAVIIDVDPQPAQEGGHTFEIEDSSAATQNILLAITALGYASVWLDGALKKEQRAEKIGRLLGLPDTKKVQILLPVGFNAEDSPRKNKQPFAERAWFDAWETA